LNSETPIVVDFWAEWCPPCKIIAPSLEQLADEYVGTFKVGKLNVDDNRETAMKYGIRGIPTLLVIKEGDVTEQIVGAHPKDTLKDKILSAL
jgi:thioredoxin 1